MIKKKKTVGISGTNNEKRRVKNLKLGLIEGKRDKGNQQFIYLTKLCKMM